jgi:hypothetical protein
MSPLHLSGLALSRLGSPNTDYPRMMRETTSPGLALEDHLPQLALMEKYIYPC